MFCCKGFTTGAWWSRDSKLFDNIYYHYASHNTRRISGALKNVMQTLPKTYSYTLFRSNMAYDLLIMLHQYYTDFMSYLLCWRLYVGQNSHRLLQEVNHLLHSAADRKACSPERRTVLVPSIEEDRRHLPPEERMSTQLARPPLPVPHYELTPFAN